MSDVDTVLHFVRICVVLQLAVLMLMLGQAIASVLYLLRLERQRRKSDADWNEQQHRQAWSQPAIAVCPVCKANPCACRVVGLHPAGPRPTGLRPAELEAIARIGQRLPPVPPNTARRPAAHQDEPPGFEDPAQPERLK